MHGIRKFTNCVRVSLNQTYEDDSLNAILLLVIRTWCQYHMLNSKCEMKRKENITAFLRTAPGARVLDIRTPWPSAVASSSSSISPLREY